MFFKQSKFQIPSYTRIHLTYKTRFYYLPLLGPFVCKNVHFRFPVCLGLFSLSLALFKNFRLDKTWGPCKAALAPCLFLVARTSLCSSGSIVHSWKQLPCIRGTQYFRGPRTFPDTFRYGMSLHTRTVPCWTNLFTLFATITQSIFRHFITYLESVLKIVK